MEGTGLFPEAKSLRLSQGKMVHCKYSFVLTKVKKYEGRYRNRK